MPRQSRIVLPDIPHHITQRGNYRQPVFEEAADYRRYCSWVKEYAEKYDLTILAFCLMENHIHFIVVPHTVDSLARAFNTIHMRYSQYMNRKHGVRGHLWQGRFFSCFMDDQHLYRAIRYVERNPVRVGIVPDAWEYRWSSARVHAGIAAEALPIPIDTAGFAMSAGEWKRFLRAEDKELCAEMRVKTGRGLAVGSERFKNTVARRLHRSLECLPPGRPKKSGK
jgi:putative transposase